MKLIQVWDGLCVYGKYTHMVWNITKSLHYTNNIIAGAVDNNKMIVSCKHVQIPLAQQVLHYITMTESLLNKK